MTSKRCATKLPNVGELRTKLDYGDSSLERSKLFYNYCRFFTRQYMSPDGVSGSQYYDRSSWQHVTGIQDVATAFLDKEKKGEFWWPSDPNHRNANRLQYSIHEPIIRETLELLLLKINHQARQNLRYKAKHGINSIQRQMEGQGQPSNSSRDQPIPGFDDNDPIDLEAVQHRDQTSQILLQTAEEAHGSSLETSRPDQTGIQGLSADMAPTADPYAVPDTPEPNNPPLAPSGSGPSSRQEPPPAKSREFVVERFPPGTKRPTASDGKKKTSKKQKTTKTATTRRSARSQPEREPQRKSTRKRAQLYESLCFPDNSPEESIVDQAGNTDALNGEEAVAVEESAGVAAEAPAITATTTVMNAERDAAPCAPPTDLTQRPLAAAVSRVTSETTAVEAEEDSAIGATKEPGFVNPADLMPRQSPVAAAREEEVMQEQLERQIELERARREKAPEETPASDTVTEDHVANTGTSSTAAELFSRVNALYSSETPEDRRTRILEDLEQRARVPEALMATATVASGTEHSPFDPRRGASPPPPDMGSHAWMGSSAMQSTESVLDALDHAGATHANKSSPELVSSSAALEAQLQSQQPAFNGPDLTVPGKRESVACESERSCTASSSQPVGASGTSHELRLIAISGPRKKRTPWTPSVPFEELTMARIKAEIPMPLSADFCGFRVTFIGAGQRDSKVLLDGDDDELGHLKLDVEDVIEDWKAENEGSCSRLQVQIRIQELRGDGKEEVGEL